MRKSFLCAALLLGAAGIVGVTSQLNKPAQAAPERGEHGREAAERALHDYYRDTAQVHIVNSYEVDGTRIFDAVVNRGGAEAQATVTGTGDYIAMGVPESVATLTPGALDTIQVFKAPPVSVTREDIHAYWLTVKSGRREFIAQLDGAGRIRDIKAPEQIREDNNLPKAGGPEAHKVSELTRARFAGVQVDGVFQAIHDPGYYLVSYHAQHGQGWAIINDQNDVTEWRFPVSRETAPEPIRRAMEREFRGDRILHLSQGAERLYKITQVVAGEPMTMLVKPDGAVYWMSSREVHRHHEGH